MRRYGFKRTFQLAVTSGVAFQSFSASWRSLYVHQSSIRANWLPESRRMLPRSFFALIIPHRIQHPQTSASAEQHLNCCGRPKDPCGEEDPERRPFPALGTRPMCNSKEIDVTVVWMYLVDLSITRTGSRPAADVNDCAHWWILAP